MPIISRREIESVLANYLQLSHEPPKESRVQESRRLVNEALLRLAATGTMHNAVGEPVRAAIPAIAGRSLLPKNATRACAVTKWFCDVAS
jgi:hypothetical protein